MTTTNELHQIHVVRLSDPDVVVRREASEALYEICCKSCDKATSAIPALIKCLSDSDDKVREHAEWAMSYCGDAGLKELKQCLASQNRLVRLHAARAIGNMHDGGIGGKDQLCDLLADEDSEVRKNAAWALGLIGDNRDRTLARLLELSNSAVPTDRSSALHALGNLARGIKNHALSRDLLTRVAAALRDESELVRWSAYHLLSAIKLDPDASLPLWLRGLEDPDTEVAEIAASGLVDLAENADIRAAVPALCRAVERGDNASKKACEALKLIGHGAKPAILPLLEALKTSDPFLILRAAEALWTIDGRIEKSLPVLAELLKRKEPGITEAVCDTACSIGPATAPLTKLVLEALATEDWDLQWAAADTLGVIAAGHPDAVDELIATLGHKSGVVCQAAARALVAIGESAIPALVRALDEGDDNCREWVADILGRLGAAATPAVKPLRRLLRHKSTAPIVQAYCAVALGKIGGFEDVVPILAGLLELSSYAGLKCAAIEALGSIGATAQCAVPALKKLLADENEDIREAAQLAIAQIEG